MNRKKKTFPFFLLELMALLSSILIFSLLLSCDKKEEEIFADQYFIKFRLTGPDDKMCRHSIKQEKPQEISGHGAGNGEYVYTGINIQPSFISHSNKDINQILSVYISFKIPETEFNFDSGSYQFKNPSSFIDYIPLKNVFEEGPQSVSSYFHEDDQTFCSAPVDETFSNSFRITKANYFIDEKGDDAVDVEGVFNMKYNSMCDNGDIILEDGSFRLKLLIDKIP